MNRFETVYIPFEGYNFELMIEYHTNLAGVFIVDTQLTNRISDMNVNKQDYYHTLKVLNHKIITREMEVEIRQALIHSLMFNDSLPNRVVTYGNLILATLATAIVAGGILWIWAS